MRMVRRISRAAAMAALPFALWAAIPSIQWCPLRWDQLRLETFLRCTASGGAPSAGCRTANADACERASRSRTPTACVAHVACPFAARLPRDPDSHQADHGRASCLAGLNGGTALRAAAPRLDPAPPVTPIAETRLDAARQAPRFANFVPVARARPPTEGRHWLPPPRAPPVLG